jgi:hypothetical protein
MEYALYISNTYCKLYSLSFFHLFILFCLFFYATQLGCALTFASKAKFEIEAKISFRLELEFHMIHFDAKHQKSEAKMKVK